jgi:hypothetical protein
MSGPAVVFMCGPSSAHCVCQCPDGECEHKWDGPERTYTFPGGATLSTVTCSRCGMDASEHDLWVAP